MQACVEFKDTCQIAATLISSILCHDYGDWTCFSLIPFGISLALQKESEHNNIGS